MRGVASLCCVSRSSARPPLPMWASSDRAPALPARIGVLTLLWMHAVPAGRRGGSPDRRPADPAPAIPLTGGVEGGRITPRAPPDTPPIYRRLAGSTAAATASASPTPSPGYTLVNTVSATGAGRADVRQKRVNPIVKRSFLPGLRVS